MYHIYIYINLGRCKIFVCVIEDCALVNTILGIQHVYPSPPVVFCNQYCAKYDSPPAPPGVSFNIQNWYWQYNVKVKTILSLSIVYGVWHTHGGSEGGRILRNSIAIVLQPCWKYRWGVDCSQSLTFTRHSFSSRPLYKNQYYDLQTPPSFGHPSRPPHRPRYCAIQCVPPTIFYCNACHTILVMAISCKGQTKA